MKITCMKVHGFRKMLYLCTVKHKRYNYGNDNGKKTQHSPHELLSGHGERHG